MFGLISAGALECWAGAWAGSSAVDVEHSSVCLEGTEVPAQMVCRPGSCSQGPLDGGKALGRADGTSPGPTHYLAWVTDTLPSLVVADGDCLKTLVVAEGDNVAGVATFHGTLPAAAVATLSHIAPLWCRTQDGHGSCLALPCCG